MDIFVIAPFEAFQDHRLSLMQLRVLLALFSFRNKNTNIVFPKRSTLAERCGYSEKVISRTTTQLVNLGWIEKVGSGGRSSPCRYKITVPDLTKTVTDSVTVTNSVTVTELVTKTVTDSVTGKEQNNEHINTITTPTPAKNFVSPDECELTFEKMGGELQQCFEWAKKHEFWNFVACESISKFLKLYSNKKPDGLRAQFERRNDVKPTGGNNATNQRANKKLSALERFDKANNINQPPIIDITDYRTE